MAKLKGVVKITGTLEGISFYETQDGIVARQKWGPDKRRLKTDPAFKHILNHGSEFGACAKDAKLIRASVSSFLKNNFDNRVSSRLNKVMNSIKNLDTVSIPGKRNVLNGLSSNEAVDLLHGFNFNINCNNDRLLLVPYTFDEEKGELQIPLLKPKKHFLYPKEATHVMLQAAYVAIDLKTKTYAQKTNAIKLPLKGASKNIKLKLKGLPTGAGLYLLVMKLDFLLEKKEESILLNDKQYACATLLEALVL